MRHDRIEIDPCGDIGEARQIYQDLWYSITATQSGTLTVSTCNATTLDTVIAVYDGCGGNVLSCNDDGVDCANFTSLLTIPNVGIGDSFIVRIGSFAYGETSSFDALIEIAPEVEGACCISLTDCVELTPTDCTAFGGTYETGTCATVSCGWAGCQSGDTPEGVPCSEDTDAAGAAADPNGGLNANPASYGSISINETICGSASTFLCLGCADDGTDLTYRDTDWYLFDNVDGGSYTITVGGEGPLLFGMVDLNAVAFVANAFSEAGAEETLTVTLPAGNNFCVFVSLTSMPASRFPATPIRTSTPSDSRVKRHHWLPAVWVIPAWETSPLRIAQARAAPTSPTSRATRATPVRSHATAPVLLRLPSRVPGPPAHRILALDSSVRPISAVSHPSTK